MKRCVALACLFSIFGCSSVKPEARIVDVSTSLESALYATVKIELTNPTSRDVRVTAYRISWRNGHEDIRTSFVVPANETITRTARVDRPNEGIVLDLLGAPSDVRATVL